jgi:hypothetical protein
MIIQLFPKAWHCQVGRQLLPSYLNLISLKTWEISIIFLVQWNCQSRQQYIENNPLVSFRTPRHNCDCQLICRIVWFDWSLSFLKLELWHGVRKLTKGYSSIYHFPNLSPSSKWMDLYSACSNHTNVVSVIVLVIAWKITHRSTLAVPISSTLAYNPTPDNH